MGQSSITGQETVIFSDNASYDGTERGGVIATDGQVWMGSTAGSPRVRLGDIIAGAGVTVTYSEPTATTNRLTIALTGGSTGVDSFSMQTGTTPVVPTGAGLVTFSGSSVAAGTNPVRTNGTAANTMQLEVQTAVAIAATDATRIGLAAFDSADFDVDANGFVTLDGAAVASTYTADDANTAVPASGNINIFGGPGVTTTASGSTITINSVTFTDTTAATLVRDNGYFATAAGTYTLPAAPAQGEIVIVYADTTGAVAVTANTGQVIRLGSVVSSTAGTATSTSRGDSLTLRFRSSGSQWSCVSSIGIWILA